MATTLRYAKKKQKKNQLWFYCILWIIKHLEVTLKSYSGPDMVLHAFNSRTWETEAGRTLWVWSQPESSRPAKPVTQGDPVLKNQKKIKVEAKEQLRTQVQFPAPNWQLTTSSRGSDNFLASKGTTSIWCVDIYL